MQFFGYAHNRPVFAEDAVKGYDYRCPECGGLLRIKEGPHRQKHFFHLRSSSSCHQSNKNHHHLLIQKSIWKSLPPGEAFLEKRFCSIHRIGDIAWIDRSIIFEIQCSPISVEEVKARNHAYQKIGFQVIWILHDKRFNHTFLSAAEAFLRGQTSYFSSINHDNKALIYDQFEILRNHRRLYKGPPLTVYLNSPKSICSFPYDLPASFQKKLDRSYFIFTGDLLDRMSHQPKLCNHLATLEKAAPQITFSFALMLKLFYNYCCLYLRYLFHKASC